MAGVSRKHHLDAPAALFIGVLFVVGVGAFYSQNNLLYIAFAVAMASLLVSGFLGGLMLMGVDARRVSAASGVVGRPGVIEYSVRNRRRLPAFALEVTEAGGRAAPWRSALTEPLAFSAHVRGGSTRTVRAVVTPTRRGEVRLEGVRVASRFPFGIMRKSIRVTQPSVLLARPRVIAPPRGVLDDAMARRSRTVGAVRAQSKGIEPEFYALREYIPGDSPRQIAWRASARRGDLVVRESAASARAGVWVVLVLLDDEADDRNESAISLASGVIHEAADRAMRVGLAVPGVGHSRPPQAMGGSGFALDALLDDLARLDTTVVDADAQLHWTPTTDDAVVLVCAHGAAAPSAVHGCVRLDAPGAGDGGSGR